MTETSISVDEKVFAFGESDFLVESFNPEQFIAKYSSSCDLDSLKSDISEFLTRCENAIMKIMNKDYESFISLATRLTGLKEKIAEIQIPLSHSREQLQIQVESISKECEQLTALLSKYRETEERKYHLQQFLKINRLLEEGETIMNEVLQEFRPIHFLGKNKECKRSTSHRYYETGAMLSECFKYLLYSQNLQHPFLSLVSSYL